MRIIFIIFFFILFSSCSTKYKSLHTDYKKFSKDINYCLKKSCKNRSNSILHNFSIISSAHAYGGGISSSQKDKVSYETFNLCLEEKGYTKDKEGIFELPYLTCN